MKKETENKGIIFDIKRMAIHDGPGIRTTVFLKGCNMNCKWCHNPESISSRKQLLYAQSKCLGCRKCEIICKQNVHRFLDGEHILMRDKCILCGDCAEECPSNALEICGKEVNSSEVMDIVIRDKVFYEVSGGGITISGGEPMCQEDFTFALLKEAKKNNLHTVLDTNGNFKWKDFKPLIPYIDMIRYDMKIMDPKKHEQYTGIDNHQILENFKKLIMFDKINLIVSFPVINRVNDKVENIDDMINFIKYVGKKVKINVLPYHSFYVSKLKKLGKSVDYEFKEVKQEKIDSILNRFKEGGLKAFVN